MYITNLHLERYRHESESNLGTSHYKPQGHQGPRKSKEGFETPGVTNQSVKRDLTEPQTFPTGASPTVTYMAQNPRGAFVSAPLNFPFCFFFFNLFSFLKQTPQKDFVISDIWAVTPLPALFMGPATPCLGHPKLWPRIVLLPMPATAGTSWIWFLDSLLHRSLLPWTAPPWKSCSTPWLHQVLKQLPGLSARRLYTVTFQRQIVRITTSWRRASRTPSQHKVRDGNHSRTHVLSVTYLLNSLPWVFKPPVKVQLSNSPSTLLTANASVALLVKV